MSSVILTICLLGLSANALANKPSKYRQECALTSSEYKKRLPSSITTVWCARDNRKDFGEMGPDVIHAMIVAAFYEKHMDKRVAAMNMLEKYNCANKEECEEFHHLLDWGIKSGHPAMYSKSLASRADVLRKETSKKLETL